MSYLYEAHSAGANPPENGNLSNNASAPKEEENCMPSGTSDLPKPPPPSYDAVIGFESREHPQPSLISAYKADGPSCSYDADDIPLIEFSVVTEAEARAALLEHVAQHCCYGKGTAKKMKITSITPSKALHYVLETFRESRSVKRVEVPYCGDPVDGLCQGQPPKPWDIVHTPDVHFADNISTMPVPHSEQVRVCEKCIGHGFIRCCQCEGCGISICSSCKGHRMEKRDKNNRNGSSKPQACTSCRGTGRVSCKSCKGKGTLPCTYCMRTGKVKNFMELTITHKNCAKDFILENTGMPDELVKEVGGTELYNKISTQVKPITSFPVSAINENSVRLVQEARHKDPNEKQICQRQILRSVPVTEIVYTFKERTRKYWVYGIEKRVYITDYPQNCCCCFYCSIL